MFLIAAEAEEEVTEAVEAREVAVAVSRMVTVNRFDMINDASITLTDRKLRSWTTNSDNPRTLCIKI